MEQIDLIPSGVAQSTTQQLCAVGTQYACYCSPLAVYVYNILLEGTPLVRVLNGPNRPIGGMASDGARLLVACSDREMFCWDVEKGTIITDRLGNPFKIPKCHGIPNCVIAVKEWCFAIGCDNGILSLYNAMDNECTKLILDEKCHITTLGVIALADAENAILVGTHTGHLNFIASSTGKRLGFLRPFQQQREEKKSIASKLLGNDIQSPNDAIVSIAPDALSPGLVLVACRDATMCLIDFSQCQAHNICGAKIVFRYAGDNQITSLCFASGAPGVFYTADGRSPSILEWHVTSATRVGVKRPQWNLNGEISAASSDVAISSVLSLAPKWLLLASRNGSVCFYDRVLQRPQHTNPSGHSETVFECRFSHHDKDVFASGSFDGTIKLWNLRHMTLSRTIDIHSNIYSIAWSPCGTMILAGMSGGFVGVYDTASGAQKWLTQVHSDVTWRVAWNLKDPSIVATTSRDHFLALLHADTGAILRKIEHGAPVYGIDFDPFNPSRVAVGCFDFKARIFDLEIFKETSIVPKTSGFFSSAASASPSIPDGVVELVGHFQDVFNVSFSPLIEHYLLTGSNDMTAKVWDVSKGTCLATFIGHVDRVRALAWSHLSQTTLLTGSWDGSIRVWDLESQKCISSVHHHTSDVYTLASHPHRPFLFVSGSRDTTIRVWQMVVHGAATSLYAILSSFTKLQNLRKPQSLLQAGDAKSPAAGKLLDLISSAGSRPAKLTAIVDIFVHPHGGSDMAQCASYYIDPSSHNLASAQQLTLASPMRRKISAISEHRGNLPSSSGNNSSGLATPAPLASIMSNISSIVISSSFNLQPPSPTVGGPNQLKIDSPVIPQDIMLSVAEARAAELGRIKNKIASSAGASQRIAKLRKAADANLYINNIETYCELLIEAGDWERALAAAPAVSAAYWRQLCLLAAEKASEANESTAAGFFICAQQAHRAADVLAVQGDFVNASVVVQKCHQVDTSQPFPEGSVPFNPPQVSPFESAAKLVQLAKRQSASYAAKGNPYLAAAAMIGSKAPEEAIALLSASGEVTVALALALAIYGAGGGGGAHLGGSGQHWGENDRSGAAIRDDTLAVAAVYAAFIGSKEMSIALLTPIESKSKTIIATAHALGVTKWRSGGPLDEFNSVGSSPNPTTRTSPADDKVSTTKPLVTIANDIVNKKHWDASAAAEQFITEKIKNILDETPKSSAGSQNNAKISSGHHQTASSQRKWPMSSQWLTYKTDLLDIRAAAALISPHNTPSSHPAASTEWEGIQRGAYIAGAALAEIFGLVKLVPRLLALAIGTFGDSSVALPVEKKEMRTLLKVYLSESEAIANEDGHPHSTPTNSNSNSRLGLGSNTSLRDNSNNNPQTSLTTPTIDSLMVAPMGSQLPTNTASGRPAFSYLSATPITGPFIILSGDDNQTHSGKHLIKTGKEALLERATEAFPEDCNNDGTPFTVITKKEALQWFQCCCLTPLGDGTLFNPYQ